MLAALAVLGAGATWARLPVWRSERALFEDTARRSPGAPRPWINLGVALEAEDDLDGAESALRHALALDPRSERALDNLALVLRRRGRLAEAEDAARKSLALEPGNADAHFNLGALLEQQGRPAESERELRAGLALREDPRAHLGLALARSDLGDHAGALSEYRVYLASAPQDSAATRGSVAWELFRLGRMAEAEREARLATASRGAAAPSFYNLGLILLAEGHGAEAEAAYARALDLDPGGLGWAPAAGDVVELIRAGRAPANAHFALGDIAQRAGLPQARSREGARYLKARSSGGDGAEAERARAWMRAWDPAAARAEASRAARETGPRGDLARLLWGAVPRQEAAPGGR